MRVFSWALTAAVALVATANCGTSSTASPDAGASGSSSGGSSGGSSGSADGAADDGPSAMPVTVTAFDKTLFAFQSAQGGARRATAPAAFPSAGPFQKISLHIQLDCPAAGGCDHWDRTGSLGVVTQNAVDGGSHGTVVEIARLITPFGVAAAWDYDVTDLAPLLTGNVTLQGFVDTWSPQMQPLANGAGWLLTATFTFTPGTPQGPAPVAVIPVWSWPADSDPPSVPYGDPSKPLSSYMTAPTVMLPAGATSYSLRSFVTGHGQGSYNNCAEFCKATHTITIGSMPFSKTPWRTCCTPDPGCETVPNPTPAPGVTPGQHGTYMYPRSGWCPGASVDDWTQDVTAAIGTGSSAMLSWGLDSYVNTCRPDMNDAGTCDTTTCAAGICAYDGGQHTEPIFYISSVLIAYK